MTRQLNLEQKPSGVSSPVVLPLHLSQLEAVIL